MHRNGGPTAVIKEDMRVMMPRAFFRSMPFAVRRALGMTALVSALLVTAPTPVFAQDNVSEARLRKIEAEIRALQRNVFPGGDERYFEPQIRPEDAAGSTGPSGPSTTAVTDILARLDAIELQLQRLTAVTEENSNSISLLSTRMADLESSRSASLALAAPEAADQVDQASSAVEEPEAEEPRAMQSNLAAMGADQDSLAENAAAPVGPSPERLAAVQEITKPQTDDAADDEYSYGYRLWNAGFYPEARQQLSGFLDQYPDHWRVTYGRNLLGRAYLDDDKPEEAARWFLRNYQADRDAARAPDSLLFLAESMIELEDTRRAGIALAEFGETYPAVAAGRLMSKYQADRSKVTCET